MLPPVTICIITYDRLPEIKLTIQRLREFFHYDGEIHWHLADDDSPHGYVGNITREFNDLHFTHTSGGRGGWGVNVNTALEFLRDREYVFLIEDDYVAKRPIDIMSGVAVLQNIHTLGAIRYDGIAAHALDLHLREVKTGIGNISYMEIDKASPHLNVYSNRPHLRHRRFTECYGKYPEHVSLGSTEEQFAHRVRDKVKCPGIAVLPDGVMGTFDHIGKSYQGGKHDMETVK